MLLLSSISRGRTTSSSTLLNASSSEDDEKDQIGPDWLWNQVDELFGVCSGNHLYDQWEDAIRSRDYEKQKRHEEHSYIKDVVTGKVWKAKRSTTMKNNNKKKYAEEDKENERYSPPLSSDVASMSRHLVLRKSPSYGSNRSSTFRSIGSSYKLRYQTVKAPGLTKSLSQSTIQRGLRRSPSQGSQGLERSPSQRSVAIHHDMERNPSQRSLLKLRDRQSILSQGNLRKQKDQSDNDDLVTVIISGIEQISGGF